MTKYEICTSDFEIRCGAAKDSIPSYGVWELFDEITDVGYEIVNSFDKEEDAVAFFMENYEDYGRTWAEKGNVFWLLRGRAAWVEKNIFYDDGEFDSSDGVIEISVEPYTREE
jgi:hypothetical protein